MASQFHKLLLSAQCACRMTSDGKCVVPATMLIGIPKILGIRQTVNDKMLDRIQMKMIRQGEYDLSSIACIAYLCGLELSTAQQDALLKIDRNQLTTHLVHVDPQVPAREPEGDLEQVASSASTPRCTLVGMLRAKESELKSMKCRIQQQTRVMHSKRAIIAKQKKHITKLKGELAIYKEASAAQNSNSVSSLQLRMCATKDTRLTSHSSLALGIMRNVSNIACCDVGPILFIDNLNRYKVAHAETAAGNALQLASAQWYNSMEELARSNYEHDFVMSSTTFSSDATGKAIYKRTKMSTCVIDKMYVFGEDMALGDAPRQRRIADILTCSDGCTAQDMISLLIKHMASIGYPTWRLIPTGLRQVRLFLYTSDQGPDQKIARKMIPFEIINTGRTTTIFASASCLDHIGHLIEKCALKALDALVAGMNKPIKYYATMTKACHLWRQHHHPMPRALTDMCDESVHRTLGTLVQLCDGGRWGGVHVPERRFAKVGVRKVFEALKTVLAPHAGKPT